MIAQGEDFISLYLGLILLTASSNVLLKANWINM